MVDETIEKVEPYNAESFKKEAEKNLQYIHFDLNEQKEMFVSKPVNVRSNKFGKEKLLLRFDVINLNGSVCDPVKQWDVTNAGLIKQLTDIISGINTSWPLHIIVKRGSGVNKATTYTVIKV